MAIHIGVNALYLIPGGVGGTEVYLRCLLAALAEIDRENTYSLFTNRETGPDLAPSAPNFHLAPQPVQARNRPARILYEQVFLPRAAARRGVQVMFNPGFTAPLFSRRPNVTVFHDLQHKRHPEFFRWFDLPFWRLLLYGSVRRSRRLIAVSPATAADLKLWYRVGPETVRVVPHGVDPRFFQIGLARPAASAEPLLLCVSTLHPHKNLDTLLKAFAQFHARHPEFRLTIAGLKGFHTESLERLRAYLSLEDSVVFTGWIPREKLYDLFLRARAFLYPSRFEGFGMPILEALAAGIPSACSDVEPMRGVAGGAALLFQPSGVEEIAAVMEKLAFDEPIRELLQRNGPAQASRYTWKAAAQATLDVLRSAVS